MDKLMKRSRFAVIENPEHIIGRRRANTYAIFDQEGKAVYNATETTTDAGLLTDGSERPYTVEVKDSDTGHAVMVMRRGAKQHCVFPCGKCCECCECCKDFVKCELSSGSILGCVKQEYHGCDCDLSIRNGDDYVVLRVRGAKQYCASVWGGEMEFNIFSADWSHQLGKIVRKFRRLVNSLGGINEYRVDVPEDLDTGVKLLVAACAMQIDFMFFQGLR